jgi:hypothetical protein
MNEELENILKDFRGNRTASDADIQKVEQAFSCSLPEEYRMFLNNRNGGEGFLGTQYLILWKAEEIVQFNKAYQVEEYAPGLLLFGSNGGGEAFAFDLREKKMTIVMVPFIGMSLPDAIILSQTFRGFLEKLFKSNGNLF